ncbi:MAG: cupin domain-containing protein [Gemmatimonadales bacterium]|nr:cupin domain-containing protein [Gemmatimonadales bacterium]
MPPIDIATVPEREIWPGYHARPIHGDALSLMRVRIEAGAPLPRHQHHHEQATTVLTGRLRLVVNGETVELGPGMTAFIPANMPHEGIALEATDVLDVFTPVREDFR